ncbi:hypothetical protein SD70_11830 [Gordoniibacillus kamchatkensis]|uniref:Uncharacterized protein n=1 Tax=Gordoniibacillus kamchatkensis TaxID=1590651 RepID=A0ABR5AIM0_9BACL|nr:hypothetical protein [Paenibacillus sp. VKM B-2647]KIL40747.1 hypothetical protein SD70_11830 [Paenibacillus sp. VKM B-2647]
MTLTLGMLKEDEYSDLLDGIKDLLKESYQISEDEAMSIINKGSARAEELLIDYFPYIDSIRDIISGIRDTLDKHINLVDQEEELLLKMINEAAVWHAFECVRWFYINTANQLVGRS